MSLKDPDDYSQWYKIDDYHQRCYGWPALTAKCFALFAELDPFSVLLHCLTGDYNMTDEDLRYEITKCERLFAKTEEPVWPALKAVIEVLLTVPENKRKGTN